MLPSEIPRFVTDPPVGVFPVFSLSFLKFLFLLYFTLQYCIDFAIN